MVVTATKLAKMASDKERYMRAAESEQDIARQLFSIGDKDFAEPLESAHQYYGAAQEIDKVLDSFGYQKKEKKKYSRSEIAAIKRGLKQKGLGLLLVIGGFITAIPECDFTGTIIFATLGLYLMFTKTYVLTR